MKFGRIVLHSKYTSITESDFGCDVILSRWPWLHPPLAATHAAAPTGCSLNRRARATSLCCYMRYSFWSVVHSYFFQQRYGLVFVFRPTVILLSSGNKPRTCWKPYTLNAGRGYSSQASQTRITHRSLTPRRCLYLEMRGLYFLTETTTSRENFNILRRSKNRRV